MREAFQRVWANPYVQVLAYLLLFGLALYLFRLLLPALFPFLLALGFAYLVHPLVRGLERRRLPRAVGVVLVYLGLFLFLGLASLLAYQIVAHLSGLARGLAEGVGPLWAWVQGLPKALEGLPLPPSLREALGQVLVQSGASLEAFFQSLVRLLLDWLKGLVQNGGLVAFLTGIPGGVVQALAALLLSVYLLYDLPRIGKALLDLVPRPYRPLALDLSAKLDRALGGFLRGQLLVAFWVGVLVGLGLFLLGVPMAGGLGFLAGVFNLIPYAGPIVAGVLAFFLALPLGLAKAFLAILVLVAVNQLDAHLLSPWILGRAVQIHPVTAILAILVGAHLLGLWGVFLAVPTAAFLKLLLQDYYRGSRFYQEG